jgi:hypothetical protein
MPHGSLTAPPPLQNLLSLGEDRYLTTVILKHFPQYKTKFTRFAKAKTIAPDEWKVLMSQRRRWINSTVHNLVELLQIDRMCGFCCFSMRFVILVGASPQRAVRRLSARRTRTDDAWLCDRSRLDFDRASHCRLHHLREWSVPACLARRAPLDKGHPAARVHGRRRAQADSDVRPDHDRGHLRLPGRHLRPAPQV